MTEPPLNTRACAYCGSTVVAIVCPNCARTALDSCESLETIGREYALGWHVDGRPAVWAIKTGGLPVEIGEPGEAGIINLVQHYNAAEHIGEQPAPQRPIDNATRRGPYAGLIITLVVIAGLYIAYHAYRYHGCLVQPGIFAWPSACL